MSRLKIIIIILSLLSAAALATAQSLQAQSLVKSGVKGGLNFATLTGADDTFDRRTGFMIGGFAKFNIPVTPFAIQPELLYSQKGAIQDGSEIRMDYLEIPVMLKFSILPGLIAQPTIFAGPYAGIRLMAEADGGSGLIPGGGVNLEDQTEPVDYGAIAGAGIDIELGSSIFTFDIRYGIGFRDVFRDSAGKNGVFSVAAGISLPGL